MSFAIPTRLLRTTSFRITLLYAGLFVGSVLVLFGGMYWATAGYMARELDSVVQEEQVRLLAEAPSATASGLLALVVERSAEERDPRSFFLLQDSSGRKLAGNLPASSAVGGWTDVSIYPPNHGKGELHRVRAFGVVLHDGSYLLVGEDGFPLDELQELMIRSSGIGTVATLLLAFVGGLVMSANMLQRVEAIARTARAIMTGDLSRRIGGRGTDDEFDHLAAALDTMLDRIEELMRGLQQVTNDIAHDMRTPLSRLRQRLETAQRKAVSMADYAASVDSAIGQLDSILDTFGALLRIAQIEAGAPGSDVAPVELSDLLRNLAEFYEPLAEEKSQPLNVSIPSGLRVLGDGELLTQMFANLLENAIRHSPAATGISVVARCDDGTIEVVIADRGVGIPAAEHGRVFQRFYRLEASRTTPGSGLGLSMVAAVAARHGLQLILSQNDPGLRVTVRGFVPVDQPLPQLSRAAE